MAGLKFVCSEILHDRTRLEAKLHKVFKNQVKVYRYVESLLAVYLVYEMVN